MRRLVKYGIPLAGGAAALGAAASQGEDRGSAILAGAGGMLGAGAGLLAGRFAGRYAPVIGEAMQSAIAPAGKALNAAIESVPSGGKRAEALGKMRDVLRGAYAAAGNVPASTVQKTAAGFAVPASTALAGLGGVAAGAVPGALGIPGFTGAVDPESYGSSNSEGARYKTPTMQYM